MLRRFRSNTLEHVYTVGHSVVYSAATLRSGSFPKR
jgi:hypothetical protein